MTRRSKFYAALLVIAFGIAFGITALRAHARGADVPDVRQADDRDRKQIAAGDEILLVFIGASFCHAADVSGFPASLERLKELVRHQGERANLRVGVIGIAVDWTASDGLAWLQRFGSFDEVLSGRNWLNTGAVDYIWNGVPGLAAVPQVVLVRRRVTPRSRTIGFDSTRVLARKLGAEEIMAWEAAGGVVPGLR